MDESFWKNLISIFVILLLSKEQIQSDRTGNQDADKFCRIGIASFRKVLLDSEVKRNVLEKEVLWMARRWQGASQIERRRPYCCCNSISTLNFKTKFKEKKKKSFRFYEHGTNQRFRKKIAAHSNSGRTRVNLMRPLREAAEHSSPPTELSILISAPCNSTLFSSVALCVACTGEDDNGYPYAALPH
jgi:hypothetical protein